MSEPFLAEIRVFAGNFPPRGWALCQGQLLPINQNQGLFSLLGTTYGGDGRTNFALPDLRGRTSVHPGTDVSLGGRGGAETVTLTPAQGVHAPGSDTQPTTSTATGATPAVGGAYGTPDGSSTASVGGGQAHNNLAPFLALNYCIALQGIFPSRD